MSIKQYIDFFKREVEKYATNRALQSGRDANSWRKELSPELLKLLDQDPLVDFGMNELMQDLQKLVEALGKNRKLVPEENMKRIDLYLSMSRKNEN